jgi:cytochrome c
MLMVAEGIPFRPSRIRMKVHASALFVIACMAAAPAWANPELAKQKNCMACHAIGHKVIGPAYKDVALKYAGQADAVVRLSQKVMKGGSGVWGAVPMPGNPKVSEAEARQLVQWILTLK